MSWTLLARLGERLSRFRGAQARSGAKREQRVAEQIAPEFSTEELAEFLEADLAPVESRPEFREQLREDLWAMVKDLYGKDDAAGRRK